jgi:small subunit ribosomal protein S13
VVRIAGIDLKKSKSAKYALTQIYGIGLSSAQSILIKANIQLNGKLSELTDENISEIREILEKEYLVESDLKKKIRINIKRLSEINCWRGKRHRLELPLRGQRTKTNARSKRRSKKTVVGKKK